MCYSSELLTLIPRNLERFLFSDMQCLFENVPSEVFWNNACNSAAPCSTKTAENGIATREFDRMRKFVVMEERPLVNLHVRIVDFGN